MMPTRGYGPGGYAPGGYPPTRYPQRGRDLEEDYDEEETFEDKFVRHDFVKKVYAILFVQLLVTFGIIIFFKLSSSACLFLHVHHTIFYCVCGGLSGIICLSLICCSKARHTFPINLILLATFTIVESIMLSMGSCFLKTYAILMAVGITAVVCIALSLFAMQTKWDFTPFSGIVMIVLVVVIVAGIVQFFVRNMILQLIISAVAALVFGAYLVIDTQMIMGGVHKYVLEPDEYILGAFHLYIDVVMIFITILNIIGVIDMG